MFEQIDCSRNLVGVTFSNRLGGEEKSPALNSVGLAAHICNCFGKTVDRWKWKSDSVEMEWICSKDIDSITVVLKAEYRNRSD